MQEFDDIQAILKRFRLAAKPYKERDIENSLTAYLERQPGITIERQKIAKMTGRFDIYVLVAGKRFCIEIKKFADRSCVDQLDRYAANVDGLILLCWQASKPMRIVFAIGKQRAKIPIELVEVKRNCSIV